MHFLCQGEEAHAIQPTFRERCYWRGWEALGPQLKRCKGLDWPQGVQFSDGHVVALPVLTPLASVPEARAGASLPPCESCK